MSDGLHPMLVACVSISGCALLVFAVHQRYERANATRMSSERAGGCLRYVAAFPIGVFAAVGACIAWYYADTALMGVQDREGGLGMFLMFFAFPPLSALFVITGLALAFLTGRR